MLDLLSSELLLKVLDKVLRKSDRLSLRGVCKSLRDHVTPVVFATLFLVDTVESAQTLSSVQESDTLAIHVREIVFTQIHGTGAVQKGSNGELDEDPDQEFDEGDGAALKAERIDKAQAGAYIFWGL